MSNSNSEEDAPESGLVDVSLHRGREGRNLKLSVGAWNTCGLSDSTLSYAMQLGYDVLGLGELHGAHTLRTTANFIGCEEPKAGDTASGVGIVLSKRVK